MKNKQRNIAIFLGIGLITIGYVIFRRKKNKEEANALIDYINSSASQVNLNQATQQGIESVVGTKIDFNKLKIDNLYGSYSNPQIKNAIANVVTELYASMKGPGTDYKNFLKQLTRIKNKTTLAFVNKIYLATFKESLFEAMAGEYILNNASFKLFSDATKYDLPIPFFSESHWNPQLSIYFNNLPIY